MLAGASGALRLHSTRLTMNTRHTGVQRRLSSAAPAQPSRACQYLQCAITLQNKVCCHAAGRHIDWRLRQQCSSTHEMWEALVMKACRGASGAPHLHSLSVFAVHIR